MSGRMWRVKGASVNDTVRHPDDSILLAYIRQQPLESRWSDIDLHLAQCSECAKHVKKLQEISISLDVGLLPSQHEPPQSQRESNWDWLESPEAAHILFQSRERERLHEDRLLGMALLIHLPQLFQTVFTYLRLSFLTKVLPTVLQIVPYQKVEAYGTGLKSKNPLQATNLLLAFATMLVITTLFVFAMVRQPLTNIFHPASATTTAASPVNATITPHAMSTPTTTATISGAGPTTNGGSHKTKPAISLCLTPNDKNQRRMHICGVNFKSGDRVAVIIEVVGSGPRILHPTAYVGTGGRFEYVWSLNGCRSVPISIVAQDVAHPFIEAQVLQNIQYDGCPTGVSGHR